MIDIRVIKKIEDIRELEYPVYYIKGKCNYGFEIVSSVDKEFIKIESASSFGYDESEIDFIEDIIPLF